MTLPDFLDRLQTVSKSGSGYVALCPSHDDRQTSLSITAIAGKILVHCFAGCTAEAIVTAVGLTMADLREEQPVSSSGFNIVATYDYRDETGSVLYQVVRLEPKSFRQRRPDGEGWTWGLGDVRRVVYRLPDLVERARVVWVEGEKDADRLWELGIPASTSPAGAQAWRSEYAEQLYRLGVREVVVLPDNDAPGEAYAAKVVTDCIRVGIEARVTPLPGLDPKGDVSDWLGAGHDVKELLALLLPKPMTSSVLSLAEAIEAWQLEQAEGKQIIIRSPFYSLNTFLGGGFSGGELIYVGSRPGIGKTAAALAFAKSSALDGFPALIVSREMVVTALARRMVTQESGISTQILKRNRLTIEEAIVVEQAILKLKHLPIWLTDKAVDIDGIIKLAADMVKRLGVRFILADYLQLIRAPREVKERRHQVEAVSKGLKGIAVEHNIPVVCLSSLSRPEKNSDKPPTLADLRESGELEHDADVVIFLHRKPLSLDPETDCILAKNREGAPGSFQLNFDGPSLTFTETVASVVAS